MRIVGRTLTACLLLQDCLQRGQPCSWWVGPHESSFSWGALALLPGPTLSLAQHSRNLWRAHPLTGQGLLEFLPFADLATTPGRAVKLREEALLDALAGDPTRYEEGALLGLHPRLVLGWRAQQEAPQLAAEALTVLTAALVAQGIEPQVYEGAPTPEWLAAEPTTLTDMAVAAACYPELRLHPRRGHHLRWLLPAPLAIPAEPLLLLHRMPRGHAWLKLSTTQAELFYDGLADPRQITLEVDPDLVTVEALMQHAVQLMPLLGRTATQPPSVTTTTLYYTPDGLPVLGPLAPESSVFVAGGMGAQEPLYAPALAQRLHEWWQTDDYMESPLAPVRFQRQMVMPEFVLPASLQFTEPTAEPVALKAGPEIQRSKETQIQAGADISRANDVRMVGKEVQSQANTTVRSRNQKPKIQTAAIKA